MMPLNSHDINKAVSILHQGGIVAFPTETVYGLGADARNQEAVHKIFITKQRPIEHPLIVHVGEIEELNEWAIDIGESAQTLAKAFWPGPMTLILKKAPEVLDLITGNQDTIGLRIPHHPIARTLLKAFGSGLAAPSANRFGRISPTTSEAVREELGNVVDMIVEGGACQIGVESTIIDMTGDEPVILRPGMITAKQITDVLKKSVIQAKKNALRVSGSLESHYAPETKTLLIDKDDVVSFLETLQGSQSIIALLTRNPISLPNKNIHIIVMSNNPKQYAHDLYHTLRLIDKKGYQNIVIENVPPDMEWEAIRDRLTRAAAPSS